MKMILNREQLQNIKMQSFILPNLENMIKHLTIGLHAQFRNIFFGKIKLQQLHRILLCSWQEDTSMQNFLLL